MSKYALKIKTEGSGTNDLLHWDVTEEMAGIDRITKFEGLIQSLEDCGAKIQIYSGEEPVSKAFFENSMQMLREIADEVDEDMDREAEL